VNRYVRSSYDMLRVGAREEYTKVRPNYYAQPTVNTFWHLTQRLEGD
jgi:hypothetical protein